MLKISFGMHLLLSFNKQGIFGYTYTALENGEKLFRQIVRHGPFSKYQLQRIVAWSFGMHCFCPQ